MNLKSLFPHLQDKCLNLQGMVMQQTTFELQLLPICQAVLKTEGITFSISYYSYEENPRRNSPDSFQLNFIIIPLPEARHRSLAVFINYFQVS